AGFTSLGGGPRAQSIHYTLVNGSGTYYGEALSDAPNLFTASFDPTSETTANVTLTPVGTLGAGTHSGSVTFRLCTDQVCGHVAWSQTRPYTVTVFDIATTGVTLGGYEGVSGTAAQIAVSPADSAHQLAVT